MLVAACSYHKANHIEKRDLRSADNIRHQFFGHVHRPISESWRGIPYSTLRGINHQVPFDFNSIEVVPKSHELPAYSVVLGRGPDEGAGP